MEEIIKQCVCQGYEAQLMIWNNMEEPAIEIKSFECDRERLSKKVGRRDVGTQWIRGLISAAAIVGILIVLLRPQYVVEAYQKIFEWFQDYARFYIMRNAVGENIPRYAVGHIPEGYVLCEEEYDEISGTQIYENGVSRLYFIYSFSDSSLHITNENNVYKIYELESGIRVHYFEAEKDGESNIAVWYSDDMEIVFTVIGDFSFSEFEKIIDNIFVYM